MELSSQMRLNVCKAESLTSASSRFTSGSVKLLNLVTTQPSKCKRMVVEAKRQKYDMSRPFKFNNNRPTGQFALPTFDADDKAPYFSIFVKSKGQKTWFPFSMVSGGTNINLLLLLMESKLGEKLYRKTLTRGLSESFKDQREEMRTRVIQTFPYLNDGKELQFGYKIVDKTNPKVAFESNNVNLIPKAEEMNTPVDNLKNFFKDFIST